MCAAGSHLAEGPQTQTTWFWWLSHCCGWLSPTVGTWGQPPLPLGLLGADRSCSELLWLGFAGAGIPWAPVPVGDRGGTCRDHQQECVCLKLPREVENQPVRRISLRKAEKHCNASSSASEAVMALGKSRGFLNVFPRG